MTYRVILKSLKVSGEVIVLSDGWRSEKAAEESRVMWRRVLGGNKAWVVNRRPGLDTLDHLGLAVDTV
jgi:hypothetical protein